MPDETPGPDRSFPIRVSAVDIGSNAIRFTAAEFLDASDHVELEYQRVPVRLGHNAFLTGRLTDRNMDAAVAAMTSFRRNLDRLGVEGYRAVATSAIRESRNGDELVERASAESGIRIEAITGTEEARLVWLAVRDRLALEGRWLLIDLGGGSLEVSAVSEEGIEWAESHPVGTVRLLEELEDTEPTQRQLDPLLEEYADTVRLQRVGEAGLRGLVAAGGNIEALAELAGVTPDERGVSRLSAADLEATTDRLGAMTNRERMETEGLREDRADVIVPAGRIYYRVAELIGADEVVVPHVGVTDGVLLDLADTLTSGSKRDG